MYHLSSDMSHRIAYDDAIRRAIEEFEIGPEASFNDFWDVVSEEFLTDDAEEAEARALSVWERLRG